MLMKFLPYNFVAVCVTVFAALNSATVVAYDHYHLLNFSWEQKQRLKERSEVIAKSAAENANEMWRLNREFYQREKAKDGVGISKYYGTFRYGWHTGPDSKIGRELKRLGKQSVLEETVRTDCITFVFDCLSDAFKKHGCGDVFRKVESFVKANHGGNTAGLPLFEALRHLGWKTYFYMPSDRLADRQRWDRFDNETHGEAYRSVKGSHVYWYDEVVNKHRNYETNTPVDFRKKLVGFGDQTPEQLKDVDFAIGVMNTGYHVFTINQGMVIEAHAAMPVTAQRTIEKAPFNPLKGDAAAYDSKTGGCEGGPAWIGMARGLSGLIVVPPHDVF